jgi:hypothetical protein
MEPHAAVGRSDDVAAFVPPRVHDPVDCARIELRTVGEHDESRRGIIRQRGESAPQRCSRPALPVRAANALDRQRMGAADDDDRVLPERLENPRKQLDLLRR